MCAASLAEARRVQGSLSFNGFSSSFASWPPCGLPHARRGASRPVWAERRGLYSYRDAHPLENRPSRCFRSGASAPVMTRVGIALRAAQACVRAAYLPGGVPSASHSGFGRFVFTL